MTPSVRSAVASGPSLRVNNFDLIRLVAASQVLLSHMVLYFQLEPTSAFERFLLKAFLNFPGVPIFFVISGFLISMSWERNATLQIYASNRFLRLFPALWACLILTIVVMLASGYLTSVPFSTQPFLRWIFWQATIFQTYSIPLFQGFGVGVPNGSLWSIPVEMQFYVILPLAYWVLPRDRKGFLIGLIFVTVVLTILSEWLVATQTVSTRTGFILLVVSCLPYVYMFFIGVMIQRLLPVIMPMLRGMFFPWLALYLLVVLGLDYYVEGWQTGIRLGTNNPPAFISLLLAMVTISAAFTLPTLSGRLLRGQDISYGTYIYHMVFINLVLYLGIASTLWQIVFTTSATYGCAALSWRFVERPALALKKRSLRAPDKTPRPASG